MCLSSFPAFARLCSASRIGRESLFTNMAFLANLMKFVTTLRSDMDEAYSLPGKGAVPVIKFLRKSKSNTGSNSTLSYEGQDQLCKDFLRDHMKKHKMVATIQSNESGMTLQRPDLFRTKRLCNLVPKVDRLARNIWVMTTILEAGIPICFTEFPTIDFHTGTTAEKSAILRAGMEAYLEGLRISDRTKAVMPVLKKRNVKMGGRCHKKGSA